MPTAPRETNHAFHVLAPLDRDSGMRIVGPIGTPNRWRRDDPYRAIECSRGLFDGFASMLPPGWIFNHSAPS
jgi:hypothetical protein